MGTLDRNWLATMVALCTLASPPAAALDDFLCYQARKTKGAAPFERSQERLSNANDHGFFDLRSPHSVCVAADGVGGGIGDPDSHYQAYTIKASGFQSNRKLQFPVSTRYFDHTLDTRRPLLLLAPANLDLNTPPPAPDPSNHDLDPLTCYQVRDSKGFPRLPKGIESQVEDLFEDRRYRVRRVSMACFPTSLNGEPVRHPDRGVVCYSVSKAKGEPRHTKRTGFHVASSLGDLQLDSRKEKELCVVADFGSSNPDLCSEAPTLLEISGRHEIDLSIATESFDDPQTCGYDDNLFFHLIAPEDGAFSVNTYLGFVDTHLGAFSGECGALEQIGCSDDAGDQIGQSDIGFAARRGEKFTLEVTPNEPETTILDVEFLPCDGDCNQNDSCEGAILIDSFPFGDRRVSAFATPGPNDVDCAGPPDHTMWYKLIAPADGIVSVDTAETDYDTSIAALVGTCGNLTRVDCDNATFAEFQGHHGVIDVPVSAGEALYLQAASEADDENPAGILDIAVHFTPDSCGNGTIESWEECELGMDSACPDRCNEACRCAPGFDSCVDAVQITEFPFTHITDTSLTTNALDDPYPSCSDGARHTAWYQLRPTVSGTATVDTFGETRWDTVVAVYPGECGTFDASDEIDCSDWADDPYPALGEITFPVTAGNTYTVQIAHYYFFGFGGVVQVNARID